MLTVVMLKTSLKMGGNEDDGFDEAYLDDDEGEWEDDEIPDDLDDLKDAIGQ